MVECPDVCLYSSADSAVHRLAWLAHAADEPRGGDWGWRCCLLPNYLGHLLDVATPHGASLYISAHCLLLLLLLRIMMIIITVIFYYCYC